MNKYKVEFVRSETFVVDVLAKDEGEAIALADKKWSKISAGGEGHYHQIGDAETKVGGVYDVTGTDDPFNP